MLKLTHLADQAFTPTGVTAICRWFAFKARHRSDGIECESILKGSQRLRHAEVAVIPSGSKTGIRRFPGGVASLDPRLPAAILSGSTPRTPFRIGQRTLPDFWWAAIFVLAATFNWGCVAEKASLHEMDHELPPHWPLNMADAAQKIQQRLEVKESLATTRKELADLIEWSPEVAADTELTEIDWMPIYELSETLRHHLGAKDISLDDCRDDIERFIVLLRESHAKLPNSNSAEEVKP